MTSKRFTSGWLTSSSAILTALLGCTRPPGGEANAPESGSGPSLVADPQAGGQTSAEGTPYVWKNVPILGGGFVTGVIFSKTQKDLIYARTDIGGAYRWDAPNRSWIPISDSASRDDSNHMGIESLAIHPTDTNKVYMAVGTYTQDWAGNGAMLRSEDRG